MTMDDFAEYKDGLPDSVELGPCQRCGSGTMKAVAYARSVFSALVTDYLLRCTNARCGGYGFLLVAWNQDDPGEDPVLMKGYLWRHPGTSPQSDAVLHNYKVSQFTALEAELELPKLLREDFIQACKCNASGYYEASVCMARRALERALIGRGARSRARMVDMIAQLSEQGELPVELSRACDEIKCYGNRGAHPDEPVSLGETDDALLLTDIVTSWLYGHVEPMSNVSS